MSKWHFQQPCSYCSLSSVKIEQSTEDAIKGSERYRYTAHYDPKTGQPCLGSHQPSRLVVKAPVLPTAEMKKLLPRRS
jgi:hypothetical protein